MGERCWERKKEVKKKEVGVRDTIIWYLTAGLWLSAEDTRGKRVHHSRRYVTNPNISFRYMLEISSLKTKGYIETFTVQHHLLFFTLFQCVCFPFDILLVDFLLLLLQETERSLWRTEALWISMLKLSNFLLSLRYCWTQVLAYSKIISSFNF